MLLIHCPVCGEDRPETEFTYGGEAHIARPGKPDELTDAQWAEFLFYRTNPRGLHFERWRHAHGCGRFFNAVRHSVTDKFVLTYANGAPRPDDAEIQALITKAEGGK